jgi:hypothetical protein
MTATALFLSGAAGYVTAHGPTVRQASAVAPLWLEETVGGTGSAGEEATLPLVAIVVVAQRGHARALRRTLRGLALESVWDARCGVVVATEDGAAAAVAQDAGLQVLRGHGPQTALHRACEALPDADWFIVVQAGSDVAPGFLEAMRRAMAGGADALQCRRARHGVPCAPRAAAHAQEDNGLALSRQALRAPDAGLRVSSVSDALLLEAPTRGRLLTWLAALAPLPMRAPRSSGPAAPDPAWCPHGTGRAG